MLTNLPGQSQFPASDGSDIRQSFSGVEGELAGVAEAVVREAMIRIAFRRNEIPDLVAATHTKSSAVDPVTVVDEMAEAFIAARLKELRPNDGLLAEEGHSSESGSGVRWIVDPIDGTVNFLYGLPVYAVSIAAARGNELVAGAVGNVATGEVFIAARGGGAFLDMAGDDPRHGRRQLQTSGCTDVSQALCATGFSYLAQRRHMQARILVGVLPEVRDIRRMGSAALDLCHLAAGRIDCYYEHALNAWDFAAGLLIAAEAGASVTAPALTTPGTAGELLTAAAPKMSDAFTRVLSKAGAMVALPVDEDD